ncbi:CobW family GTP-binding protein [Plesiomonas sp.]|uniref:CobW family GTP-binding protein n=1 Tax=Plesiomonas sp. TaxID=2486279 RepID=UPI003F2AB205
MLSNKIKTNLITGFLGSGKTTTIRHLLASKPEHEKWAVLVNEFGEIGIDGTLLRDQGAVVKEIPGGCLCCVAGLPMQVGLNMLISQHRPDRILIEPTGLGHPKQVLDMLTGEYYQSVLTLGATLCVLDPRHLQDTKYCENENFRDQIAAADVLIANKTDLCSPQEQALFTEFVGILRASAQQKEHFAALHTEFAEQGKIPLALLDLPAQPRHLKASAAHQHKTAIPAISAVLNLHGNERWRRAENQGQGYFSCGWIFDADTLFDMTKILELARTAPVIRAKGVVRIAGGTLQFNRQQGEFQIETADITPADSRVEFIHDSRAAWNTFQQQLLQARIL